MATDLSFEEKVDYIYKELKSQKRTRFLNFFFKVSILAILIFWAINVTKWLENDTFISNVSNWIGTIIKPIVNELIKENTGSWIIENNKK